LENPKEEEIHTARAAPTKSALRALGTNNHKLASMALEKQKLALALERVIFIDCEKNKSRA